MKYIGCAAVAAAFALSACGGGDSSPPPTTGGGGGGGGGTPPPAITYTKYEDLTGVQTFQTTCGGEELSDRQRFPLGGFDFGDTVRITSDRSGPTYDVELAPLGFQPADTYNFTQDDIDPSAPEDIEGYLYDTDLGLRRWFNVRIPEINGNDLEYTRIGTVAGTNFSGIVFLICAFGVPTDIADIPANQVNYVSSQLWAYLREIENASISGAGPERSYASRPSLADAFGDPATGELRFSLDLKGFENIDGTLSDVVTDIGTYSGQTTLDGTSTTFNGVVVNENNGAVGNFGGWFFGPQGRTMAVSYTILDRRADDTEVRSGGVLLLRR